TAPAEPVAELPEPAGGPARPLPGRRVAGPRQPVARPVLVPGLAEPANEPAPPLAARARVQPEQQRFRLAPAAAPARPFLAPHDARPQSSPPRPAGLTLPELLPPSGMQHGRRCE